MGEKKKEESIENSEYYDDDELEMEFGSIFGKKKEEKKESEHKKEKEEEHKEKERHGKKHAEEEKKKKDDEEEIAIDFGKIKGFFKGKEDKNGKREIKDEKEKKEDEDEISFDFGKIKKNIFSIFSGKETDDNKKLKGYGSKALLIALILIPLIVSTYIRMQPDYLPMTDQWAKQNIYNVIREDAANIINAQYPNLPDANKNKLIDEEVGKADKAGSYTFRTGQFSGKTIDLKQQITANSNQLKEFFKDENGVLYTPDIDPYYWQRYAVNIVEKGHIGDEIKDGKQWDNHQIAPNGREVEKQDWFYPYTLAWFYKVLHFFNNNLTVIRASHYYPVFISSIIIILVFLIARRIAGSIAGFFAAMMAVLHPAMLNRTLFAHVDSDVVVIFFSVLVMWIIFEAFEAKTIKKQIILAIIAGFSVGLYSLAWSGWWYIFDFIIITVIIAVLANLVLKRGQAKERGIIQYLKNSEEKGLLIITAVFTATSGIFVTLFRDFQTFIISPFLAVIGFTNIKAPIIGSLWPNVLTTVAELNESSVQGIINQAGGLFLFSLALSGVIFALLKKPGKEEYYMNYYTIPLALILIVGVWLLYISTSGIMLIILIAALTASLALAVILTQKTADEFDLKDSILLAIFFIGTVYAGTKGVRFIILLVPALSIGFGIAVAMTHRLITRWVSKELHIEKAIAGSIFAAAFLLLFFTPQNIYGAALVTAQQDTPIVNDAWYYSLKAIQQDSKPNAIITSWWDFGHHFKLIADRPVTFDGTTQDQPQAHWVGKFFMTDNEKQAVGILRMIDCGANNAFDRLNELNSDAIKSVNIIYEIIELNRTEAKKLLMQKYALSDKQSEEVLKNSHCDPPEAYVIASEDMIGKSGVWAHFGSWNFERAEIWQEARGKKLEEGKQYLKKRFNYSDEKAEAMYYEVQAISSDSEANSWIAPWPSYAGNIEGCSVNQDLVQCTNSVNVNLTTNDSFFATPQGNLRPASFVYATKNGTAGKIYDENVIPQHLSAMVMPLGNNYASILSSPELANSMFTRLFYMRGHGLKHFDLISYQRSITGWNIFVWKVNWNGNSTNILDEFKEPEIKEAVKEGDKATVNYIGYLEDGTVFDSTIKNWKEKNITNTTEFKGEENTEFQFTTGNNEVIKGFEKNILGMELNEEKTFSISPEEAYSTGALANKALKFRIKLLKIE